MASMHFCLFFDPFYPLSNTQLFVYTRNAFISKDLNKSQCPYIFQGTSHYNSLHNFQLRNKLILKFKN